MKKTFLLSFCVLFLLVIISPIKVMGNNNDILKVYCNASIEDDFIDNQILVVLNKENSLSFYDYKTNDFANVGCLSIDDLTKERKEEVINAVNGIENNVNTETFKRILLLTLDKHDKQNVLDCIKKLEKRNDIYSAEPNYCLFAANDSIVNTDLGYEIGTNNVISQWATSQIDLDLAWGQEILENNLEQVYVGVIDRGIKADENIEGGCEPELIGKVDQVLSKSFNNDNIANTNNPFVELGAAHGTFIAGIIAARTNDFFGIEGVSKTSKLVSLKINFADSDINEQYNCQNGNVQLIESIIYAGNHNIKLLNASFGLPDYYSTAVYNTILNYNGLIVCAAGNFGTNNDVVPYYPAAYDLDNIITVGASNDNDQSRINSNYGLSSVDLFAPGENIVSIGNIGNQLAEDGFEHYYISSGTSFAAPYVTGVAAMIWSRYPELTWEQVKERILSNVDYSPNFEGKCVTSGRLNAYKAYINYSANHNNIHTHTYVYTPFDSNQHICTCSGCSYTYYEEHHWVIISRALVVPPMNFKCSKCGARKIDL